MTTCTACGAQNRGIARFCKHCGAAITTQRSQGAQALGLEDFVGLVQVKKDLAALINVAKLHAGRKQRGLPLPPLNLHCLFKGATGTGKTSLARYMAGVYASIGILDKAELTEVSASDLARGGDHDEAIAQVASRGKGGVVVIDEIHKVPELIPPIMRRIEATRDGIVFILSGLARPLDDYFAEHPDELQRFGRVWYFPDLSDQELADIAAFELRRRGFRLAEAVPAMLPSCIARTRAESGIVHRNGWLVTRHLLDRICERQADRLAARDAAGLTDEEHRSILAGDIPPPPKVAELPEEVFARLDALTGLEGVKKDLRELYNYMHIENQRKALGQVSDGSAPGVHFVFTGNPGTGKTTVARILADILFAMGALPTNGIVEKAGKDLVAKYVGHTADKVNGIVDSAIGKLLFIDEAYGLTPEQGQDSFSKEAIDTLLKRLEDDRGRFVCAVAGYEEDMQRFIQSNEGLASRFTHWIRFEDFNPAELASIFRGFAKGRGYSLDPEAEAVVDRLMQNLYAGRQRGFGNAREVRKIFESSLRRQATRLAEDAAAHGAAGTTGSADLFRLDVRDILPDAGKSGVEEKDPLDELASLVGLEKVKAEVKALAQYLQIESERAGAEGRADPPAMHMVFTGNPGTGKTTVARILGRVFKKLGLLPRGHLVETDRSGLVAGYVGQTALKTQKAIDQAMGGILFIDEAYTLAPQGDGANFGQEAIDTLLKRMEDDRNSFAVFAAGYEKEMERFIQSNPGLMSRFTRFIHFEDYSPEELTRIYSGMLQARSFVPGEGFMEAMSASMEALHAARGANFANGRSVRNCFELTLQRQAARLSAMPARSQEDLRTLKPEDLP